MAYASLTLIEVKSVLALPRFAWHSSRSVKTAKVAPGNIQVKTKLYEFFVFGTMSLWTDRDSMLCFLRSRSHLAAMGDLDKIGVGKVYGYDAVELPNWEEARRLINENGRTV